MSDNSHASSGLFTDDESFLDAVFDLALERLQSREPIVIDDLLDGREHLRHAVVEVVETARKIGSRDMVDSITATGSPTIPGYEIRGIIGQGGMGTVYAANQLSVAGRTVALKVLPAAWAASASARRRFLAEARAAAKIRHENVVPLHDAIAHDTDGPVALVMELVEGRSLAEVLRGLEQSKSGALGSSADRSSTEPGLMELVRFHLQSPAALNPSAPAAAPTFPIFVCRIGVAIAQALQAAHDAGLIHRDVKPSNILLRRDGTPLLSDFGLVQEAANPQGIPDVAPDETMHTQTGHFLGTAAYAPPEQLRGEHRAVDHRSDCYSLGATLFHALTLRPMPARSTADAIRFFERGLALPHLRRLNARLPRDLDTIVAKATDPAPSRRYQTTADLADDLERLLNLQPIRARPVGAVARVWKAARRNRRTIFVAAGSVILTLSLVAVAVLWWVLLPRWRVQALREARLALMDEQQGAGLWVMGFHEQPMDNPTSSIASIDRALLRYKDAEAYDPFNKDIALELAVVRLARAFVGGTVPTNMGASELQGLPRLNAYVRARADMGLKPKPDQMPVLRLDDFHAADAGLDNRDLRALGLLAYLTQDIRTASDAWLLFDAFENSDPFVSGALGMLYLVTERPALAYPRLQYATEDFPNVGFLTVYLADAARGCADLDRARKLLDSAGSMPLLDSASGLERVRADLDADAGKPETAERLYQQIFAKGGNSVAPIHYARWLAKRGETTRALRAYAQGLSDHSFGPGRIRREFVDLTEDWWRSLTPDERSKALLDPAQREWVETVSAYYRTSAKMLGRPAQAFRKP